MFLPNLVRYSLALFMTFPWYHAHRASALCHPKLKQVCFYLVIIFTVEIILQTSMLLVQFSIVYVTSLHNQTPYILSRVSRIMRNLVVLYLYCLPILDSFVDHLLYFDYLLRVNIWIERFDSLESAQKAQHS